MRYAKRLAAALLSLVLCVQAAMPVTAIAQKTEFITAGHSTKASGTYTITGVKNPSGYYVRIRNVYEYNGKTYYSAWKTVKVKPSNNPASKK